MTWLPRAAALALLSLWFWPPAALALCGLALAYAPYLLPLAALPTIVLLGAILGRYNRLPRWAWAFATPDCPYSPYSQYEPQALPYYRFGRVIGDYLWFAWRNQLNGLSLHWGAYPDYEQDKFTAEGAEDAGRYVFRVYRKGALFAWCYRNNWVFLGRNVRVHFGWKWLEKYYLLNQADRVRFALIPPAMVALQVTLRKA